jgi:hypothetical protein
MDKAIQIKAEKKKAVQEQLAKDKKNKATLEA